jgi:hypothetical protein
MFTDGQVEWKRPISIRLSCASDFNKACKAKGVPQAQKAYYKTRTIHRHGSATTIQVQKPSRECSQTKLKEVESTRLVD